MSRPSGVPKAKALEWLREQAAGIPEIRQQPRFSMQFKKWLRDTSTALERVFGPGTRYVQDLEKVRWNSVVWGRGTEEIPEDIFQRGLERVAALLDSCISEVETRWEDAMNSGAIATVPETASSIAFISPSRIAELRALTQPAYDVRRLVRLAEEIDTAFNNASYHAVAALTRALMDHVPPIFGYATFAEVANNYGGSKSFRTSMQHLATSARAIGDSHLHVQIRTKEVLPTATQVNFSNDIDVLLSEIVRALR